jgi:carboxylate-amine ligase
MLDMARTREVFEASTDFTLAVEEEFQLLDAETRALTQRFSELKAVADRDPVLAEAVAGELIESEIEIRSGKAETWAECVASQQEARRRLFRLAADNGVLLGATGTHPWSPWQEQRIIDTEHYRRVAEGLQYVAWRNNTFGIHVHVGIQGADRAVAVCDRLRPVMPELLAVSANSPFVDGCNSGLHSARTQIFTKSFPRCGVPDAFGSWAAFRDYLELLIRTRSIVEYTQVWWSVRPHLSFGTVEVRICDAQVTAHESEALAALITATVLQAARDDDEGRPDPSYPRRLIEENVWRAIRHGMDGRFIDLDRGEEEDARAALERVLAWTEPVRAEHRLDAALPALNGAQRQRRALDGGAGLREMYADAVRETKATYAPSDERAGATAD